MENERKPYVPKKKYKKKKTPFLVVVNVFIIIAFILLFVFTVLPWFAPLFNH